MVAQFYIAAVLLSLWYLFKNNGYELVLIGILIDGYYQAFYSVPTLTICSAVMVILASLIKPQLLMYTEDNEVVS